jgi:hypothetical protein
MLMIAIPALVVAQKHAPRPSVQQPGIYPEGSTRLLRHSDMVGLTSWDLKIMRNEIFARHGYIFQLQEIADYFNGQSWYVARYKNVYNLLSYTEKKNIEFIKLYE